MIENADFCIECEYHADFFAKKFGKKDSLVSSLDKFTNKIDSKKTTEFNLRKNKLNSIEIFDGQIRRL